MIIMPIKESRSNDNDGVGRLFYNGHNLCKQSVPKESQSDKFGLYLRAEYKGQWLLVDILSLSKDDILKWFTFALCAMANTFSSLLVEQRKKVGWPSG